MLGGGGWNWVVLGGGGRSWVKLSARFSNTHYYHGNSSEVSKSYSHSLFSQVVAGAVKQ